MSLSLESMRSGMDRGWKNLHWTCGLKDCNHKLFMRSVPQSRVGISLGPTWYCSLDCFVKVARHQLSVMGSGRSIDMPRTPRMSIGSVMLSKGYLTDEELRGTQAESRRNGEALVDVLVRSGLVDEWHPSFREGYAVGISSTGKRPGQPVGGCGSAAVVD